MNRLAWLALLALLSGCGQKGPLFLPGEDPAGTAGPAAEPVPDTAADEPDEEETP